MRATGIVRRVDELGRIVIPKEIRRTMRMKEGAPLEIYTGNNGEIILKKYSLLGELKNFANEVAESIFAVTGYSTIITDKDEVIATSGVGKQNYINKSISKDVDKIINLRQSTLLNKKEGAPLIKVIEDDTSEYTSQIIVPINASGDTIGSIIIISYEPSVSLSQVEAKIANAFSNFLAKQIS